MPDNEPAITAEALSTWLTPIAAYRLLEKRLGAATAESLSGRLSGGMIESAAKSSAWETTHGDARLTGPAFIPNGHWKSVNGSAWKTLWASADIRILVSGAIVAGKRQPSRVVRYFDVRFDPAGVQAMLPEVAAVPSEPKAAPVEKIEKTASQSSEPLRKPVPAAHLEACFEAYRKIYAGSANTEEAALDFARRMFPNHSIARQKVRQLRGKPTMGRPKKIVE